MTSIRATWPLWFLLGAIWACGTEGLTEVDIEDEPRPHTQTMTRTRNHGWVIEGQRDCPPCWP